MEDEKKQEFKYVSVTMEEEKKEEMEEVKKESEETKKKFKPDTYAVSFNLALVILLILTLCVPLSMDSGAKIIVARCAVVLGIVVFGLFLLCYFRDMIRNTRSRFIDYLENYQRDRNNRTDINVLFLWVMALCIGNFIPVVLQVISPDYEQHQEVSDGFHAFCFSMCFVMSVAVLHHFFTVVLQILCQIVHWKRTTVSVNMLLKLEMLHRMFPKLYLGLNMISFRSLYTYVGQWPIHSKAVIFASFFYSFMALLVIELVIEVLTPPDERNEGKLVESVASSWKDLVESPGWKNTEGKLVESPAICC